MGDKPFSHVLQAGAQFLEVQVCMLHLHLHPQAGRDIHNSKLHLVSCAVGVEGLNWVVKSATAINC